MNPAEWIAGPAAEQIDRLFWAMTGLGGQVFLIFCGALLYALVRRRGPVNPPTPEADRRGARAILLLGAALPALILIPLLFWTMRTLAALDPATHRPDLVVEVVGKQWWWELRYRDSAPGRAFVTANELHVPVGRRVELRLTSSDVIHSFWIPRLNGKTDLIPGRENVTWIEAARPGVYDGRCAEYCGLQHARMGLLVIAHPEDQYQGWAARQRAPAAEPGDFIARAGQQVFLQAGCALCHAVRGTPAGGKLGPDLTHVGSRRTLAAGTLPNTTGHLAGWIANPQGPKPGAGMPRVPLSPQQLQQLHRYVRSLE